MNSKTIQMLRYKMGLNQHQFAEKVGLSVSALSKIESGYRPVSKRTKTMIYQTCQVDDAFMELVKRMSLYDKLLREEGEPT